jgi:hypothetical protein
MSSPTYADPNAVAVADVGEEDGAPPPSKRQRCEQPAAVPTVSTPDVTPPAGINLGSVRRKMTEAFEANDLEAFLKLLYKFSEIGGWDDPYDDYLLYLVKELCELTGREMFMAMLVEHDPSRFTEELWLRVVGTAPLAYMDESMKILVPEDRLRAFQKLSILGGNPTIVEPTFDARHTLMLIEKDAAKKEWLKVLGIRVEWP